MLSNSSFRSPSAAGSNRSGVGMMNPWGFVIGVGITLWGVAGFFFLPANCFPMQGMCAVTGVIAAYTSV